MGSTLHSFLHLNFSDARVAELLVLISQEIIFVEGFDVIYQRYDQARAADAEEAEALSALRGLEAARHLGLQRILLLSDCQRIVRAFRGRSEDLSWGALTIAPDLRAMADWFFDFRFEHVNRKWNDSAHILAARGVGFPSSCRFVGQEANNYVISLSLPRD
ncbi:hypothetical protein GIB67_030980 [Kingdonia uniflora]|uniref:RNase H type-1 domain-containing protein n=1 Tax=Kingdonia uniflora TaxID=39325 RepID=A0A7J7L3L4_9MAGN|nr:hypothetical protein GIB67_030980 [Kingdonia uniflora]